MKTTDSIKPQMRHKVLTQMKDGDYSTPKGENFSVYKKLKDYLINR